MDRKTNPFSLSGNWKYIPDAEEKFSINDIKLKYENGNSFSEMYIPQNWQLAGLDNFNGSVWFIKEFQFDLNEEKEDLKVLKFLGVDYFADVWLNWIFLGHHEGYFQNFIFRIENNLRNGDNVLVVRVSSPLEEPYKVWPAKKKLIKGIFNHHDCRPGGWSYEHGQDRNTGGIWNDVLIHFGYPVYINNLKISSQINYKSNKADLFFKLQYISSKKEILKTPVEFLILSPSKKKFISDAEFDLIPGTGEIGYSIRINDPEFWWSWDSGNPDLYEIEISSGFFEEQNINYGIREVHLDDKKQFFLNNKRLFLRGTNLIAEQFLSNLSKERISQTANLIKEANINIVRVHAHVNRKELYEEFDRQGILIWQDFSLQWTYDGSPQFINNAAEQIRSMVRQLYNHASIAVWCCHNEPGEQTYSLDPVLFRAVKSEDGERIVRSSSNYEEHPYDGWYWGKKEHFAAVPMGPLVTEFGAQALPDLSSLKNFITEKDLFPPNWKTWEYHNFQIEQTFNIAKINLGDNIESFIKNSQDYQAELIRTAVDFYRRKRFNGISGIFQFMFIDCWPSITWSVVDYYLKTKSGFYSLKKSFQPLYISIDVRQDQYFAGKKFSFLIYLINDLHKAFKECKLNFYIDEKYFNCIDDVSINEDDISMFDPGAFNFIIPHDIKPGRHTMKVELLERSSGSILSGNDLIFSIIERIT